MNNQPAHRLPSSDGGSRPTVGPEALLPERLSRAALEAPEISGYRDLWAAAPPALVARYGLAHARLAGGECTLAAAMPGSRLLNHALGLGSEGRKANDSLEAVESFFGAHGGEAIVAVPDGAAVESVLTTRGYEREYAWVKFARAASRPPPVSCPLAIRAVDGSDAACMGELIVSAFDLPTDMATWFAALVGRVGWHCFGAYDDTELVGCGALYVDEGAGWLTWAATDPRHRGRGAQKALLAARIDLAHAQGLDFLVTETGEQEPGRPDASYRNILAAGFRPVFRRPFWRRSPDPSSAHTSPDGG